VQPVQILTRTINKPVISCGSSSSKRGGPASSKRASKRRGHFRQILAFRQLTGAWPTMPHVGTQPPWPGVYFSLARIRGSSSSTNRRGWLFIHSPHFPRQLLTRRRRLERSQSGQKRAHSGISGRAWFGCQPGAEPTAPSFRAYRALLGLRPASGAYRPLFQLYYPLARKPFLTVSEYRGMHSLMLVGALKTDSPKTKPDPVAFPGSVVSSVFGITGHAFPSVMSALEERTAVKPNLTPCFRVPIIR
jgi:hypothetical protein